MAFTNGNLQHYFYFDPSVKPSIDRIHLKSTYYAYAKYLESIQDTKGAIEHYENSDTFRTEVPRMLYALGKVDELEAYVQKSNDAVLLKWWGAYLESKEKYVFSRGLPLFPSHESFITSLNRYDKAKKYYSRANDHLSLVRIACFKVTNAPYFFPLQYYMAQELAIYREISTQQQILCTKAKISLRLITLLASWRFKESSAKPSAFTPLRAVITTPFDWLVALTLTRR